MRWRRHTIYVIGNTSLNHQSDRVAAVTQHLNGRCIFYIFQRNTIYRYYAVVNPAKESLFRQKFNVNEYACKLLQSIFSWTALKYITNGNRWISVSKVWIIATTRHCYAKTVTRNPCHRYRVIFP